VVVPKSSGMTGYEPLLNPVLPMHMTTIVIFTMIIRAWVENDGVDSIQSRHTTQKKTDRARQGAVLVIEEARPINPDRDVPRKTEIIGMGVHTPSMKIRKPDQGDDGNE
jgi:hypothetical protein